MSRKPALLMALLLAGGVLATCHQVILTAPPGSSIVLFANPEFIPANGGVSVITALVLEPAGTPVADGTVIQFFTNLGRIDEQGKTNDGVARVNLISDARSGTATVRGFSGGTASGGGTVASPSASPTTGGGGGGTSGQSASVVVTIGNANVSRVDVTANPTRVISPRESTIRAFVFDANGNPVANVPVIFTVSLGNNPAPSPTPTPSASPSATPSPAPAPTGSPGADFMESRGAPVFTDNNGVATDRLLVRTPADAEQQILTITATTSNGRSGSVIVLIN